MKTMYLIALAVVIVSVTSRSIEQENDVERFFNVVARDPCRDPNCLEFCVDELGEPDRICEDSCCK